MTMLHDQVQCLASPVAPVLHIGARQGIVWVHISTGFVSISGTVGGAKCIDYICSKSLQIDFQPGPNLLQHLGMCTKCDHASGHSELLPSSKGHICSEHSQLQL